ncbi:MAG: YigZ family protein [Bacteroidota bacterium]|nr:YigZ family protein [Bacteroidota bacterium]MDP4218145.1 YigZ family protein [Bacteroidota bacterium]MDP4248390.1 YigZ family protein [Bacteroidota bacterium]MDP4252938.1 YigZ family protein [Bacteroidota bacterium]
MTDFYNTIGKEATAEFKDRGSRFIAFASPIHDAAGFRSRMVEIRQQHAKATHHCFAYRLGLDGNNHRVSDDGEPSGTAGKPILGQIDSRQLVDVLVIVVRYFGGTQLGVAGLTHAYRSAAALCLQMAPILQKPLEKELELSFDYTRLNDVLILVRQHHCRILRQDLQLFSSMTLAIPQNKWEELTYRFKQLRGVEVSGPGRP